MPKQKTATKVYKNIKFILCGATSPEHAAYPEVWWIYQCESTVENSLVFGQWVSILVNLDEILERIGRITERIRFWIWTYILHFNSNMVPVVWHCHLSCVFKTTLDKWAKTALEAFHSLCTSAQCSQTQHASIVS